MRARQHLRISVALCTYNGARYIAQQLRSILDQEYPVWQIVVCDDGSSDDTFEIVQHTLSSFPGRLEIYRNSERKGVRNNFSFAISRCAGDLVALSDQDDLWFPEKTTQMVALFQAEPDLGGVFSDAVLMDERGRRDGRTLWQSYDFSVWEQIQAYQGRWEPVLLRRPIVTGATMMFRSELTPHILPIPDPWMHDAWIAWQILMHSRLVPLNQRLMAYRVHGEQQIGVPPTLSARLKKLARSNLHVDLDGSRKRVLEEYGHQIIECKQLEECVAEGGDRQVGLRLQLGEKRQFYDRARQVLFRSRLRRASFGVSHLKEYRRFSYLGLRAMFRDIAL